MDPIKNILSWYLWELCTGFKSYLRLLGEEVVFSVLTKKEGRASIGSWSWSLKSFDFSQAYNLLSYYNFMLLNTQILSVQLDECDKCITNIWIKIAISVTLKSHMTFYNSILITGLSPCRPTVAQIVWEFADIFTLPSSLWSLEKWERQRLVLIDILTGSPWTPQVFAGMLALVSMKPGLNSWLCFHLELFKISEL